MAFFCFKFRSLAKSTHRIYFAALAARRQGSVAGCLGRRAPNALHRSVVDSGSTRAGVRPPTRPGYGRAAASSPISISQLCTGIRYLKCASLRHCPQCRILCLCKEHVLCVGASLGKADTFDASHAKADDAMMCELSCWPAYFSGHRRSLCQAISKPLHSPSQILRICARPRISASVQRCPRRHHRWRSCRRCQGACEGAGDERHGALRAAQGGLRRGVREVRGGDGGVQRRAEGARTAGEEGARSSKQRRGGNEQQQRSGRAAPQRCHSSAAPALQPMGRLQKGCGRTRQQQHRTGASEAAREKATMAANPTPKTASFSPISKRSKGRSRSAGSVKQQRQPDSTPARKCRATGRAISCSWRGDQGASML